MLEYDLVRVFDHPLKFRMYLPSAIVLFGGGAVGSYAVEMQWRPTPNDAVKHDTLLLRWDTAALQEHFAEIDDEIAINRKRDHDDAARTELAAVVVGVAAMSVIEAATVFSDRSRTGTSHDFFLNDRSDEMIEIAGRWEGGLPGLFAEKCDQSAQNSTLRKRWVSVTIFSRTPRNMTEGLLP